jgi:aldose 1-epimerase
MGSSVGRFGNRIKDGKFSLDGKDYTLATNDKPGEIPCHLHGGKVGFNKVLWTGKRVGAQAVEFKYVSKDGEEGYPGNLSATVTYTLTEDNELKWEAQATTDAATVLNLVHHSYWNLSGDATKTINDHVLQLEADAYLPTNAGLIPTGEKAPVADTPMDFTKPTAIGARVEADFEALKLGLGYDHCWVLRPGSGVRLAARLVEPESGRVMEISTNQPAIQFYGGNFLDGKAIGKKGVAYNHRTALCLETENYPDAPNQPSFPSAVLKPGETYHHVMVHKFSVQK